MRRAITFLQEYFSEAIIFFISIAFAFIDADFLTKNRYYMLVGGILLAAASTYSKIKDDLRLNRFLSATEKANKIAEEAQDLLRSKQAEDEKVRQSLKEQSDFIGRLIKQGLIAEQSIYEIVHRDRFLFLFCYQNVPDQERVQRSLGRDFRNPSLDAVEQLGFVRVGSRHNLYVIPYDMLPSELRNPAKVEKILKKLLDEHWEAFLVKFQNTSQRAYNQYIADHPNPKNCTYMIVTANLHDVILDHIGYNSFSREFKDLLQYHVDIKRLRKEIRKRKHEIRDFIRSISYDLLLGDISPRRDKETIIQHEQEIRDRLGVESFTDYKDKKDDLQAQLGRIFSSAKAAKYAGLISDKSKKYDEIFSLLGVEL